MYINWMWLALFYGNISSTGEDISGLISAINVSKKLYLSCLHSFLGYNSVWHGVDRTNAFLCAVRWSFSHTLRDIQDVISVWLFSLPVQHWTATNKAYFSGKTSSHPDYQPGSALSAGTMLLYSPPAVWGLFVVQAKTGQQPSGRLLPPTHTIPALIHCILQVSTTFLVLLHVTPFWSLR